MTTATQQGQSAQSDARLLDVQQVADEYCKCSTRHIYRLSDAGKMPRPVKLGALVRWRRSTGDANTGIEDWIAAGCPAVRTVTAKGVRA